MILACGNMEGFQFFFIAILSTPLLAILSYLPSSNGHFMGPVLATPLFFASGLGMIIGVHEPAVALFAMIGAGLSIGSYALYRRRRLKSSPEGDLTSRIS